MMMRTDVVRSSCRFCGEQMKGRSDKRFCNNACRVTFHNVRNESKRNMIKAVNKVLLKNYQILKLYWDVGERDVSRYVLVQSGFNFNYFTSIQKLDSGASYCFCYDIGFSSLDGTVVRILKKEKR